MSCAIVNVKIVCDRQLAIGKLYASWVADVSATTILAEHELRSGRDVCTLSIEDLRSDAERLLPVSVDQQYAAVLEVGRVEWMPEKSSVQPRWET